MSLAISQANTCVIAGLEDARILIWDLVTGNCRCSLTGEYLKVKVNDVERKLIEMTLLGHNAPVTLLKLDPLGKILLSGDDEGRDRSMRLWDLSTGIGVQLM